MNQTSSHYNPLRIFTDLWIHRGLIWQMSKREIVGRYRGSMLGLMWSFFNPLLMLAIYTIVFGFVFKARWGSGPDDKLQFAITLFAGLVVHSFMAENLIRAPGIILGNENFVKRLIFPLETLPWVGMVSALFHAAVSFSVLLIFNGIANAILPWTIIFLPLVFLPLVLLTMGISWFLASLGVYFRDVGQVMGIAVTALLFLSPILYPISMIPEKYRSLLYINPLTFIIGETRAVVLWGALPDFGGIAIYLACAMLIAWLGFVWFQLTRKGFADVV